MASQAMMFILLVVMITPYAFVKGDLIVKPRQMVLNIVYDLADDGETGSSTATPTGTVPSGSASTGSSSLAPSVVTETNSPPSVTATSGSTEADDGTFHCPSQGTFADPKDCKSYYRCNQDLVPTHDKCMFGLGHFDPSTKGCAFGGC